MNNGLLLAEVFYHEKPKNKQRKLSKNLRIFLLHNNSGSHLCRYWANQVSTLMNP